MINVLVNMFFTFFLLVTYLILILFALYHIGFFETLRRTKFTISLKSKIESTRFGEEAIYFLRDSVVPFFSNITSNLGSRIIGPIGSKILSILKLLSGRINSVELKATSGISSSMTEVFTVLSLIFRKAVESEIQIKWSVALVFIILIYFILTIQ